MGGDGKTGFNTGQLLMYLPFRATLTALKVLLTKVIQIYKN